MPFEWDSAKDAKNRDKHGIGFEEAASIFSREVLIRPTHPGANGEARWIAFGMLGRRAIVVIYTERNDRVRIISARPAKRKERRLYHGPGPKNAG